MGRLGKICLFLAGSSRIITEQNKIAALGYAGRHRANQAARAAWLLFKMVSGRKASGFF
jgi:hypothetical protein